MAEQRVDFRIRGHIGETETKASLETVCGENALFIGQLKYEYSNNYEPYNQLKRLGPDYDIAVVKRLIEEDAKYTMYMVEDINEIYGINTSAILLKNLNNT